jgi:hypothetical protein
METAAEFRAGARSAGAGIRTRVELAIRLAAL